MSGVTLQVDASGKGKIVGNNALGGGTVKITGKEIHWHQNGSAGSQIAVPPKAGTYQLTVKGGNLKTKKKS